MDAEPSFTRATFLAPAAHPDVHHRRWPSRPESSQAAPVAAHGPDGSIPSLAGVSVGFLVGEVGCQTLSGREECLLVDDSGLKSCPVALKTRPTIA